MKRFSKTRCSKKPAAKTGRTSFAKTGRTSLKRVRAQGSFGKRHYVWPAHLEAVEKRLREEATVHGWSTSPEGVSRVVLNRYTSTVATILEKEFNYDDESAPRRSEGGTFLRCHFRATQAVKPKKARQPVAPKHSLASSLKGKPDGNDDAELVVSVSETSEPPAAEASSKRHPNIGTSASEAASGAKSVKDAGGGSSAASGALRKQTPQRRRTKSKTSGTPTEAACTVEAGTVEEITRQRGIQLQMRLEAAFRPTEPVLLATPTDTVLATYVKAPDACISFMAPKEAQPLAVQWMPQQVADWLYQATHYAIPLIQAALGTKKAFDKRGQYLDAAGCPASGGQIVAFWGTEMASRRERGLFPYDNDVDWEIFITRDFDFHQAWLEIKKILDPLGLLCTGPVADIYYRISPMQPLTSNAWDEYQKEARLNTPGLSRAQIKTAAHLLKKSGQQPVAPTGKNYLDFGVARVCPGDDVVIPSNNGKTIVLKPERLFPIVEGYFGPLRVPLPASPAVLDKHYGVAWPRSRAVQTTRPHRCDTTYIGLLQDSQPRVIWPAVPMNGCPSYLGCFSGAGTQKHHSDVEWRWLEEAAQTVSRG